MDDEAAFDILNDYEPGFALQSRKEVLWDLVIVYPDDLVDESLRERFKPIPSTDPMNADAMQRTT